MENIVEQGMTRRHTFFCIHRERHTQSGVVVEVVPKEIEVFGKRVRGWLITKEEPAIDKQITLEESLDGEIPRHHTE